jgi:GTP-binding protein
MFLDRAEIEVIAGGGGKGCSSFRREKYVPFGGPDGGDGGKGGDVIFVVDPRRITLQDFRYKRTFRADRGQHGQGSGRTGRSAEDLLIPVPPGTLIHDADTGEALEDMTQPEQRYVAARGGRGGRGNLRFVTSTNRAPRNFEEGRPGETRRIRLELKIIADVGLVGFPNAGKSTFLASVSEARPKIADYPFTTLSPNLGVARLDEDREVVIADIPGILEGAHEGKGLGLEFLRHIERTRVLLFIVDLSSSDPVSDFEKLRNELRLYGRDLLDRPFLIVLTKADLFETPPVPPAFADRSDVRVISAVRGEGVRPLLEEVERMSRAQISRGAEGGSLEGSPSS